MNRRFDFGRSGVRGQHLHRSLSAYLSIQYPHRPHRSVPCTIATTSTLRRALGLRQEA